MRVPRHTWLIGLVIRSLIVGGPCCVCQAQNQITKLVDAFGPDFQPALHEVQELRDDALQLASEGKVTHARALLEKALSVTEESLGANHRDVSLLLSTLAEFWISAGDLDKAKSFLNRSLETAQASLGSEHPLVAEALNGQASLNMVLGNYDEALSLRRRSLEIFEKAYGSEHIAVGLCLCGMGNIYANQYRGREAIAALQRSRSIIEKTLGSDSFTLGAVLDNLSAVYREQGEYKVALGFAQDSLRIRELFFGSSHPRFAQSMASVGWVYLYQENYAEAKRFFQNALAIFETDAHENQNQGNVAICLDKLIEVYWAQGNYAEALRHYSRSVEIKKKAYGEIHPLVANSYETFGEIQQARGNHDEALKSFGLCLKIRLETLGRDHPSVANAIEHLGSVYLSMQNYSNALASFEGVLSIREKAFGKEHPHVAVSLAHLGHFWYQFGQTLTNANTRRHCISKSITLQEQSINTLERISGADDPEVITAKEYLAAMVLADGDPRRAIVMQDAALTGKRRLLVGQLAVTSELVAHRAIQRLFGSSEIFHTLCATRADDAFQIADILGAKQLALNKALLEEIQTTQAALNADPRSATRDLQDDYQRVQYELRRLPDLERAPIAREANRPELLREMRQLETKLAERVGLVAQMIRERNLTLDDIARSLPPQSALVDFIQYRRHDFDARTNSWKEQRYAAYLTFPLPDEFNNLSVKRVDLGEAGPINEAVGIIAKRFFATPPQYRAKDVQAALQKLRDLIYAPLARHLTNVSHLIVCPDGQLNRLPFEMLPVGNKFLVDEKIISYVTSGREVVRLTANQSNLTPPRQIANYLVMGNPDFDLNLANAPAPNSAVQLAASPALGSLSRDHRGLKFKSLPGAEAEARSVAKLLGEGSALRLGANAREAELKAVQSPRVLHLATHGFYLSDQDIQQSTAWNLASAQLGPGLGPINNRTQNDWENPLVRCGIALAGANHAEQITNAISEDGILTGLEASQLNLQGTELVILSACDSGSGEVKIGEGVMSLRRAFRIAGAETVLASHWSVSDKATSQLMTEFMRRWRAGESRAKAWREAQLSLLHSKDFANPYFWAAFTLTGQWR